ncbi:MAG: c-type cytochrome [Bacteroidetes bacterium]|nr:c-type cytochrome [Bacteroidota bacterium]MBS1630069.1 c-type cytochrome [Bacteroidota bacterium]
MKSAIQKLFFSVLFLAPGAAFAAENGTAPGSFNPLLWGLFSIILVLAVAIIMLLFVYQQLAFAYRDKLRKERSGGTAVKALILLLMSGFAAMNSWAQEAAAATAPVVAPSSPLINGIPRFDFYAILGFIAFELLLIGVLLHIILRMVSLLRDKPQAAAAIQSSFLKKILHKLTNTVAVKDEERIVLQHDYDGIRELDNSLPPWWKYGFIATIIFAFAYMWYYQVHHGPNQIDEYKAAVAKAEKEQAAYMAKAGNVVDESNVTLIEDKAELADAAALFKNTCAACHREDAGGMVGPNLTDNYWLHGGTLQDVFKSIKYGWKDKGMPEWQHNMSAKQIAGLASYIKHLSGKNVPGGKAPQGELFVDGGNAVAKDSSAKASENKITQHKDERAKS